MIAVFGGMGVRGGGILIALTILLLDGYHAAALALSLMGYYVAYMIAEITYVAREMGRRRAVGREAGSVAELGELFVPSLTSRKS